MGSRKREVPARTRPLVARFGQNALVMPSEQPICPACDSPMVLRTAGRGRFAGQGFWGCSQYPLSGCEGKRPIEAAAASDPVAGGFAQAEFERQRAQYQTKLRAALPLLTSLTLIVMAIGYVALASIAPWLGVVAAIGFGAAGVYVITRLPREALFWERGAHGERKTAEQLDRLADHGFVLLYDRLVPGGRGNIDALAIGPSGVFVIETKNLKGKVEVRQDALFVADQPRQTYVEQVYRQALATQVALSELLNPLRLTVTPVLCIHGGQLPRFEHAVAGVLLVGGRQLGPSIGARPTLLEPDQVQRLAQEADRRMRAQFSWER